jgi:hypothetical protein
MVILALQQLFTFSKSVLFPSLTSVCCGPMGKFEIKITKPHKNEKILFLQQLLKHQGYKSG